MQAYLGGDFHGSRETGGRSYYGPMIDRIQLAGKIGSFNVDPASLGLFHPRFDSPPYPPNDMIIYDADLNGQENADMRFKFGSREFSGPIIHGEYSLGASQEEVHAAVSAAAVICNFIFGAGEGGVHPNIRRDPEKMLHILVQVATGLFGIDADLLRSAIAVTIKMSQGAKVGMGGHLPGRKNKGIIPGIRGMPEGVDVLSDASRIFSIEEMRALVQAIKYVTGRPALIKVGASHGIGYVVAGAVSAGADGIIIDCFGGTGASPNIHRDHTGMDGEIAIYRAHKKVESMGARDHFLIIAAGRIDTPEKAFFMNHFGADAVLQGTASLILQGCKVVDMCPTDCLAGLTGVPDLPDGSPKRKLDVEWATRVVSNGYRAFNEGWSRLLGAAGYRNPKEARGRVDRLRGVGMPDSLARILDISTSGHRTFVPLTAPQQYFAKLRETLARDAKTRISGMGRTTDLDPPYSWLDLMNHDGRTVIGPAYDHYRETVETLTRLPGQVNISIPFLMEDDGSEANLPTLAAEVNTIMVADKIPANSRRRIIPIDLANSNDLENHVFDIRQSSGVLLSADQVTPENLRKIKTLSGSTPIYVSIKASQNIREDVVNLAKLGVNGIIVEGTLALTDPSSIDRAINQADDALATTLHEGSILRRNVFLIAKTQIRTTRDIYTLNCLGADAVLSNVQNLITNPTYERQLNFLRGIGDEQRLLMASSGFSMESSLVGNRPILRAHHLMPDEIALEFGVDKLGLPTS